jgi:hypothetical protein
MGFVVSSYRGHKLVWHDGGIDGFTAVFAFLPQDQIGVVALANLDGTALPYIVPYSVFDRLLGLDKVAWSQRYLEREKKAKDAESEAEHKGYTGQKTGTHLTHAVQDYPGEYAHPGYGTVIIALDDKSSGPDFKLTLNRINRPLRHFHYDIFEVPANPLDPFEKLKVAFHIDLNGDISSLSIAFPSKEIMFARVAEKRMRNRSFLEPFTGQYDLFGSTLTIALEGESTLVASLPGEPKRELVPKRGTMFDFKEQSGRSIEFKPDATGKVGEAVMYRPDGVVVIKRK